MRAASAQWRSRARGAHAMSYDGPLQLLVRRLARALYVRHLKGRASRRHPLTLDHQRSMKTRNAKAAREHIKNPNE